VISFVTHHPWLTAIGVLAALWLMWAAWAAWVVRSSRKRARHVQPVVEAGLAALQAYVLAAKSAPGSTRLPMSLAEYPEVRPKPPRQPSPPRRPSRRSYRRRRW